MTRSPWRPDFRRSPGPPPGVVALLAVEGFVVAILIATGVSFTTLLTSAGPVIALTLALLNPTVQELGRRKPKLSVEASEAGHGGVAAAPALRPWPIDVDRVVGNEMADARQTLELAGNSWALAAFTDPFATRATAADQQRARQAFEEELVAYEAELRTWLESYVRLARERADTFELTLRLENAPSGAHADAVTVVLELPDGAERVDELPEIKPPPDRPTYQPPRPRRAASFGRLSEFPALVSPPGFRHAPSTPPRTRRPGTWTPVRQARQLEAGVGDVQAGRSFPLGDPMLIRVAGAGRHEMTWKVFSKSLLRPVTGTLILEVPNDSRRPPFGRLHGVLEFLDVPIVDNTLAESASEDDTEADLNERVARREVRRTEPPTHPPTSADDRDDVPSILRQLDDAATWMQWRALGLDPTQDGAVRCDVRPAAPADSDRLTDS
jgi:hypothetical protein